MNSFKIPKLMIRSEIESSIKSYLNSSHFNLKRKRRRKSQTIVSINMSYSPIDRSHLMLIGHKNGIISLFKRSVKDIANVIYDYAHLKDLKCLHSLISKQKNVDLQTMKSYEQSKFVICGVTSGVIHIIDRKEDRIAHSVIGHSGNITCLNIYLKGAFFLFCSLLNVWRMLLDFSVEPLSNRNYLL